MSSSNLIKPIISFRAILLNRVNRLHASCNAALLHCKTYTSVLTDFPTFQTNKRCVVQVKLIQPNWYDAHEGDSLLVFVVLTDVQTLKPPAAAQSFNPLNKDTRFLLPLHGKVIKVTLEGKAHSAAETIYSLRC